MHEFPYLLRYAGSGVLNTLAGASTIILITITDIAPPFIANICGYIVGLTLSFFVAKKYVFLSDGRYSAESIRYFFSYALCFSLNLLVLWLSLDFLKFDVMVAQLLAAAAYSIPMYLLSRCFVFGISQKNGK